MIPYTQANDLTTKDTWLTVPGTAFAFRLYGNRLEVKRGEATDRSLSIIIEQRLSGSLVDLSLAKRIGSLLESEK